MSGNKLLLDTNIILYLLSGDETIAELLDKKKVYISVITEMELLSFSEISKEEEQVIKDFIKECKVVLINSEIKNEAVFLRRKYKTKLPDAIIIATALYLNLPLVTADGDFKKIDGIRLIYYQK